MFSGRRPCCWPELALRWPKMVRPPECIHRARKTRTSTATMATTATTRHLVAMGLDRPTGFSAIPSHTTAADLGAPLVVVSTIQNLSDAGELCGELHSAAA